MCGRVRFAARVADDAAYLCHCRMCQKATGSVSIAFRKAKQDEVEWIGSPPDLFRSSAIARRGYCACCGTSISFVYDDSDAMDLTVASFDAPDYFQPHHHFGAESIHRQWIDTSALPEYRTLDHEPTVQRWIKTIGKLPD